MGNYQVKDILKQKIEFKSHNLIRDSFPPKKDIIFCRNVIIYFDRETKNTLFSKFYNSINDYGFLFLGHSESLFNGWQIYFF